MFTPLETSAITGFVSLVVALAVHVITRRNYVSQLQCGERHGTLCGDLKQFKEEQRRKEAIQFRMLRALIVHNKDIPPEKQEQILNETPGGN